MSEIVREKARQQLERFAHLQGFPITSLAMDDLLNAFERVCSTASDVVALCDRMVDNEIEKAPSIGDIHRAALSRHNRDKVWDAPEKFRCSACEDTHVITDGLFANPRVCGCTPERLKAAAEERVKQVQWRAEKVLERFPELAEGADLICATARRVGGVG